MLRTGAPPGPSACRTVHGVLPGRQSRRTSPAWISHCGPCRTPCPPWPGQRASLSCLVPSAAPAAPAAPPALCPATSGLAPAAPCANPAAPCPAPGDALSPVRAQRQQAASHGAACPGQPGAGVSPTDTGGQIRQFSRARRVVLHLLRWRLSYPGP